MRATESNPPHPLSQVEDRYSISDLSLRFPLESADEKSLQLQALLLEDSDEADKLLFLESWLCLIIAVGH
jgi:hypothetical protein